MRHFTDLPVVAATATLLVSGCAANAPTPPPGPQAQVGCIDDSQRCLAARQRALDTIMADRSRSWIDQRPNAATYASGVRLFAFMKLKNSLSCHELAQGLAEARRTRPTLEAARGQMTHAQFARGALLGDEVATQLRRRLKRKRCRV